MKLFHEILACCEIISLSLHHETQMLRAKINNLCLTSKQDYKKIQIMTKKTFKQIYEELDSTPPKTKWIRRIAKVTMRSELTVRMWLNGRQTPEPLVQKIIAKELGVEVNELFPKD